MDRSWIRGLMLVGALAAVLPACASSDRVPPASSSQGSLRSPSDVWLAVLASARDPNTLDGPRADAVAALGQDRSTHVVVSPSACFSGLPSRYGGDYILGVWEGTEASVRAETGDAHLDGGWIGQVVSSCVD